MQANELKQYIKDPTNPEDFQVIQSECEDVLKSGDAFEAQQLADYLGEILQTQAGRLQGNPQLYEAFQSYWHRLAFRGFVNLSASVKGDLISRRLLYAVSRGYNPDELIQKFFQLYLDKDSVKNAFVPYVKNLEENTETLGSASLTVEDKKFLPQLKNWVFDYSKFPSLNAKRGSIDRLNYLNQSQNVRGLTQPQRQALLKILKFYDDMLNPEPMVGSQPRGLADYSAQEAASAPAVHSAAPAASAPPAIPRPPVPAAAQQQAASQQTQKPEARPISSPYQQPYQPQPGSVRFATIPQQKPQGNSAPPQPSGENDRSSIDINRKLEELKKRVE